LGSLDAWSSPFKATKTTGTPLISPVNAKGVDEGAAADEAGLLGVTERLAGLTLPVTVDVTVEVVVSVA